MIVMLTDVLFVKTYLLYSRKHKKVVEPFSTMSLSILSKLNTVPRGVHLSII